jgi:hypothetical protein
VKGVDNGNKIKTPLIQQRNPFIAMKGFDSGGLYRG